MTARLHRAWRESRYRFGGAEARIGKRSLAVDAVLRRMGVAEAGFLTAWNPWGRRAPEGRNRRLQAALLRTLRRWPVLPGRGGLHGWWEEHVLLGADARRCAVLARRFRQGGWVLLRRGQAARLRLLPRPG